MSTANVLLVSAGVVGVFAGVTLVLRRSGAGRRARQRLFAAEAAAPTPTADAEVPESGVRRWLYLAGYRDQHAVDRFWAATVVGLAVGLILAVVFVQAGLLEMMEGTLRRLPGNVGHILLPAVWGAPLLICYIAAFLPTLRVRSARRQRVRAILQDISPSLELFASLAQAGLGFDASLERVMLGLDPQRPLAREFRTFQTDALAGTARVRCLRRFAARIELPQTSSLTSALVRAHEVGTSLASTMRQQADDLRVAVRERALARAQSLPTRLVFPLVICFLPGVFAMTLGPAFHGFLTETASFGTGR